MSTGELRRLARSPTKKACNKALPDTNQIPVMPAAAAALAASALVLPPSSRSPMPT